MKLQEYINLTDKVITLEEIQPIQEAAIRDQELNPSDFAILLDEHITPKRRKVAAAPKVGAVTYEQLLTLPWYIGQQDGKEFQHLLQPGYTNIDGDYSYFGTDPKGKRIITVNTNYVGHTSVTIKEDGDTRTVFHGHVRSFEELKLINSLVL